MDPFEAMVPIFGMIFSFGIPGIIIFWYLYSRHRERMRLIEKGLTPEEVKSYFQEANVKPKNPYSSLKFGILLTFIGLGVFLANLVDQIYDFEEGIMAGIIIFFAGAGFLLYFAIVSTKIKKNQAEAKEVKTGFQNQI